MTHKIKCYIIYGLAILDACLWLGGLREILDKTSHPPGNPYQKGGYIPVILSASAFLTIFSIPMILRGKASLAFCFTIVAFLLLAYLFMTYCC